MASAAPAWLNGIGNDLLTEVHFWVMLGVCVQLIRFASPRTSMRSDAKCRASS